MTTALTNLYVRNIPMDWTAADLIKLGEKFGPIVSAKLANTHTHMPPLHHPQHSSTPHNHPAHQPPASLHLLSLSTTPMTSLPITLSYTLSTRSAIAYQQHISRTLSCLDHLTAASPPSPSLSALTRPTPSTTPSTSTYAHTHHVPNVDGQLMYLRCVYVFARVPNPHMHTHTPTPTHCIRCQGLGWDEGDGAPIYPAVPLQEGSGPVRPGSPQAKRPLVCHARGRVLEESSGHLATFGTSNHRRLSVQDEGLPAPSHPCHSPLPLLTQPLTPHLRSLTVPSVASALL